jgi:chitin synthase
MFRAKVVPGTCHSPGQAIMDDNVMRKYTTVAEVAREHVQFDQGEDRWLCTLLLQRGWRVEYAATRS